MKLFLNQDGTMHHLEVTYTIATQTESVFIQFFTKHTQNGNKKGNLGGNSVMISSH
jgi:hypothetical protein